jgi:hypothetical protein
MIDPKEFSPGGEAGFSFEYLSKHYPPACEELPGDRVKVLIVIELPSTGLIGESR